MKAVNNITGTTSVIVNTVIVVTVSFIAYTLISFIVYACNNIHLINNANF